MEKFKPIVAEASAKIKDVLGSAATDAQLDEINKIVDKAVILALLESQHRAVDAALHCPEAEQDLAHKIANEIRRKNDALIANLSAMR